jgi:hypothetical protein
LEYNGTTLNVYGGSIHSNRDIGFKNATINVEKDIKAHRHIQEKGNGSIVNCNCFLISGSPLCSANPSCIYTLGVPIIGMPMIYIDTSQDNSYIKQAKAQDQYYTSQANFFSQTNFTTGTTKDFSGVVYIEGGLTLNKGRTMNMTGVLAVSGPLVIGDDNAGSPFDGVLNITRPDGQPSGALTTGTFTLRKNGNLTGTGLIYTSGTTVDSSDNDLTFTGGVLTYGKATYGNRTINLYYDSDVINTTLIASTTSSLIVVNHWEEEYQ